jgi:glycosyltransferase involved in cell wall biosynthesis
LKSIKALLVGSYIEPPFSEGAVNLVLNWSRALRSIGCQVTVLSNSSLLSGDYKTFDLDFKYVKTPGPRFEESALKVLKLQRAVLNNTDYDITHFAMSIDGVSAIPMSLFLKIQGRKIINSYHIGNFAHATRILRNSLYDRLTVPSYRLLNSLRVKNVPTRKLRLLYPCIDETFFTPRDKRKIRHILGIDDKSFVVFTTGHFKRGRMLSELIGCVKCLVSKGADVNLLIGWTGHGESDYTKEIFELANKHKFVKVIPPSGNIHLYYNASDVYVLSAGSNYVIETPLSLIEAQSSGIPTIAFDVNASSEIITHGINGFIIKSFDFLELFEKLNSLMINEELRKEFGINARCSVIKKYSYSIVGNLLMSIYEECINGK